MAYLPAAEQAALIGSLRLVRKTPYTIVTRQRLIAELEQVRRQGFAENNSESELGVSSIAAPIRDRNSNVVAAISIVGQPADGETGLKPLARPLIEAASRISHALGWKT